MPGKGDTYSDANLIKGIQAGGTQREKCIKYLYERYRAYLYKLKSKYQLSPEEAQDAYADAVVTVSEQIQLGNFQGKSKISTYLYSIFSNKCVDKIRKKTTPHIEEVYEYPEVKDSERNMLEILGQQEDLKSLNRHMEQLGGKCKAILLDWAYYGYSMEEIAERNELKNSYSAATQKYKCLKKLMELIADKMGKTI